jgi:undecaprenyl-diphosphatase
LFPEHLSPISAVFCRISSKIAKFILDGLAMSSIEIAVLIVGMVVAYVVSMICIKLLVDFVKKHDFKAFGIYRIILGALVITYFLIF